MKVVPDPRTLHVGDRIRIVACPKADVAQMAVAMRRGNPDAQFTVRILQRLADRRQVVCIDQIDEYGKPWFSYRFRNKRGRQEEHSLAVMDEASWEMFDDHVSS